MKQITINSDSRKYIPYPYGNVVLFRLAGTNHYLSVDELMINERQYGRRRTLNVKRAVRYW